MRATSEWTEGGMRVAAEGSNGMIVMTCEAQAVTSAAGTFGRGRWMLGQVGIPSCTPRPEAERMVRHWLAFFADETLSRDGLAAFREVFASFSEHAEAAPAQTGSGPNQNNMN